MKKTLHAALVLALFVSGAAAQKPAEPAKPQPAAPAAPKEAPKPPEEKTSQTRHTAQIGGQQVSYTATAGTMLLRKDDGTPTASIFYIAYVRDGVPDVAKRPITFAFNGGPGSSSVWLHMGTLGPRRVQMQPGGEPLPPPYKLVDNEYSILDVTDLVFIDPVSTGYSRAVPGEDEKKYHGITGDVESVGEFIRLYASRNARWGSPKFLAGESYGTTRAAALSGYLQQHSGMYLNGIVLLSTVLNFQTLSFDVGNDLPYMLFLPTYTAAAWYHKKLPEDLRGDLKKALAESESFASSEYALALIKGDTLSAPERAAIAKKLARYTGLDEGFIERANLRVAIGRFTKELLRQQGLTIGRFDSRITGTDRDSAGETPDYDPSYPIVQGPFTALWNQYVRTDLKFESDLPYEILTGKVWPWGFGEYQNRYVNVAETLRSAMTANRALRVFVANGYYDLATPFFATEYTFNHLELDPALRKQITMEYYDAGHMMYIHRASIEKEKRDIARFIRASVPE